MLEGKINVVFIGTYNESEILSGPEKVCKRIFEEYSKIQKAIFIGYFQDGRKYSYFKKLFGYEIVTEVNGSRVLKLGVFRILYVLLRSKPKTIHILSFNRFAAFVYIVKLFIRVNILYTLNGVYRHEYKNKYCYNEPSLTIFKNIIAEIIISHLSDRIFFLSEMSKSIFLSYYNISKVKLVKIINGLDNYFLESDSYNDSRVNNSLVFIGNINRKEKGFDFLIKSLLSVYIPYKLFVISDINDISDKSKLSIDNSKLVIVNKMVPSQMIEFFKDKNIIVSTSEYEPFSISVLEAISCGLIPIITRETGVIDIIEGYYPNSFVDYGDTVSLSNLIRDKITNLYREEYRFEKNNYSWKNVLINYYVQYYA